MAVRASNGVQMNKKALSLCVGAGLLFVYLVYSWMSVKSNSHSNSTRHEHLSSWKIHDSVEIPSSVRDSVKKINIIEKELELKVFNETVKIFYRTVESTGRDYSKRAVLFLHGASSSSEIWQQIGTLQLIAAMHLKPVAVDLPGWANSRNAVLSKQHSGHFLRVFIEELKLIRPVIVSASMSGRFSLPYIMEPDPTTCQDRVRAFVPLAPVSTEKFTHSEYHRCEIPVMIVYGTKDKTLGLTSVGNLRNMPNSEITPMNDAGHASYQERPEEWHKLLYNFLLAID